MLKKVNDPITLEIIQNSLQAAADEMFAVMKKTAMSSIIYEVLDMGTGITDARGALASSGAGIPAFIGVLDKAVKVIVEEVRQAWRDRAGRRVRHQRSLLWRRHPSERHHRRHAGIRRRAHHRLDRQHRPQFRRRRHGAGLADRRGDRDLPGRARLPAIKLISKGETIRSVMEIIKVNSRMPDVLEGDVWAAIASVRIGAQAAGRARRKIWRRDLRERHVVVHGFRRAGVARRTRQAAQGHVRACRRAG